MVGTAQKRLCPPLYKMTLQVDWVRRVGKGPPRAAPAIGITQDMMKRLRLLPTLRS